MPGSSHAQPDPSSLQWQVAGPETLPIRSLISQTKSRNAVRAMETYNTSRAVTNCLSQSPPLLAGAEREPVFGLPSSHRLRRGWREAWKQTPSFFQAFPRAPVSSASAQPSLAQAFSFSLPPFLPGQELKASEASLLGGITRSAGSHGFNGEQDRQGGPCLPGACTQGF